MLEIAGRQASGTMGGQDITGAAPVALTMLSAITFAIGTPLGWLATYLVADGSCAMSRGGRRREARRSDRRRDAPDHRAMARPASGGEDAGGLRGACRDRRWRTASSPPSDSESRAPPWSSSPRGPKPDWTPGTVLDCGDRWLAVGGAVQRSLPVGLRTVYPLVDIPATSVFRRIVRYELPPRVE